MKNKKIKYRARSIKEIIKNIERVLYRNTKVNIFMYQN